MGSFKPQMSFEHLLMLQDVLDARLCFDGLPFHEYELAWSELLVVAGYTSHEYELLVDERWDRLGEKQPVMGLA